MRSCALFLTLQLALGLKIPEINEAPEMTLDKEDLEEFWYVDDELTYPEFQLEDMESMKKQKILAKIIGDAKFGNGCPNSTAPSVAVCIAGLSRRFASPKQPAYLKSRLLEPMINAGAIGLTRSEPDVFVHTKLGGYPTLATDRESSSHDKANTMDNVMESVREIGAVDYVVEEGWGSAHSRQKLGNPQCFHPHGPVEGVMSYYYDSNQCLQQIKKVEEKTGKKYDFVIHTKPDTREIEPDSKIIVAAVQCKRSMFVRDAMSYQTRAAFEIYGNIWNDQFANRNPSMCKMKDSFEHFTSNAVKQMTSKGMNAVYIR
jgi:hypothetical protein